MSCTGTKRFSGILKYPNLRATLKELSNERPKNETLRFNLLPHSVLVEYE